MGTSAHTNGTRALTARQEAFIQHYTAGEEGIRGNATQSAIAAGFSPKSARQQGADLLAEPYISVHIDALRQAALDKTETKLIDWASMLPEAEAAYRDIVTSPSPPQTAGTRLAAARDIVERVAGKVAQQVKADGVLRILVRHE